MRRASRRGLPEIPHEPAQETPHQRRTLHSVLELLFSDEIEIVSDVEQTANLACRPSCLKEILDELPV